MEPSKRLEQVIDLGEFRLRDKTATQRLSGGGSQQLGGQASAGTVVERSAGGGDRDGAEPGAIPRGYVGVVKHHVRRRPEAART